MKKPESQASDEAKELLAEVKKAKRGDSRQRVYGFMVYEDSSYPDWEERLEDEHIAALVSPWHDKDVNPDGTPKKKHKHVMLMFEGKKSVEQINEIRERVLGPNYNPGLENISSMRGYARYLTHMDNPEKAQYSRADIRQMGGADYNAIVCLPSDDNKMVSDIMDYIRANDIRYYSDLMVICKENNPEWFNLLVSRKSYVIIEFIKSESARMERMERATEETLAKSCLDLLEAQLLERMRKYGFNPVNPSTGEIMEDDNNADSGDS